MKLVLPALSNKSIPTLEPEPTTISQFSVIKPRGTHFGLSATGSRRGSGLHGHYNALVSLSSNIQINVSDNCIEFIKRMIQKQTVMLSSKNKQRQPVGKCTGLSLCENIHKGLNLTH